MSLLSNWPAAIAATGALGTAAFGLVDALKALPGGGLSRAGFKFIREVIARLTPRAHYPEGSALSRASILHTLQSQWINGTAEGDQVNIAKSLIKLRLIPETAPTLATATGVDSGILTQVAESIATGQALTTQQSDVYGRFDLLLTTLLDQAYQRGDQRYRNTAKFAAIPVSIGIALAAYYSVKPATISPWEAVIVGLVATPLAPIAKDLATALTNGVQAIQSWKS
jgi:hypothetical protein